MQRLLEAASLRILLGKRHKTEKTKMAELASRNELKDKAKAEVFSGELQLVPLTGTAFSKACQVLWSVCPLSDHHNYSGAKDSKHLVEMLQKHEKGAFSVFGAIVQEEHAPVDQVLKHLTCLCSLPQSQPGSMCVKTDSPLHDDLRACWKHLSAHLTALPDCDAKTLENLRSLPCVAVALEDVADQQIQVTTLTLPKFSFFQLPLLKGKEANLRLYLRRVHAETSKEASVFRVLGANGAPRAVDYAGASERVAAKAKELGRANWEWVVAVLEACIKGVHEEVSDEAAQAGKEPLKLTNLHMFTSAGQIEPATHLLWADEPKWLKRCETADSLHFCSLNGQDQREIAMSLVSCAGLRQLSKVLEERRVVSDAEDDGGNTDFKETVEHLIQSDEFAAGLHAVILKNNDDASEKALTELTKDLREIKFIATAGRLRSGLFWTQQSGTLGDSDSNTPIPGSEVDQQVYFDETERFIYIGDTTLSPTEDACTAELVVALRRALPTLWKVDSFLLEALLRSAILDGIEGIEDFLLKRDIKVEGVAPRQRKRALGPGDNLPQDLQNNLLWAMDSTFGEGESVAVLVDDVFTIGEVAKFPDDQKQDLGEGLTRSYFVRIGPDKFEARKHFEVYKIHHNRAPTETCTDLELLPPGGPKAPPPAPGAASAAAGSTSPSGTATAEAASAEPTEDDEKQIKDMKKYLHEMSNMTPADYKAVMRRLFKTWHPDKVGDTPLSKRVFHMLRSHEQWYKRKSAGEAVGDDSWLDRDDESAGMDGNATGELLAITASEDAGTAAPSNQSSWFQEFEREMQAAKEEREKPQPKRAMASEFEVGEDGEQKEARVVKPRVKPAEPPVINLMAPEAPPEIVKPRIVDKALAPRYMQEAQIELVAARRLMKDIEDMRTLPSRAVWHCQQAVEMALRAVMLRTCGVAEDEAVGGAAHDLIDFIKRLKTADANTEEQRRAQKVPLTDDDVEWLKRAYLAARYPKPGRYGIPAMLYQAADAERAFKLADGFLEWAAKVEDLPDPSKFRRRWSQTVDSEGGGGGGAKRPLEESMPTPSSDARVVRPRTAEGSSNPQSSNRWSSSDNQAPATRWNRFGKPN